MRYGDPRCAHGASTRYAPRSRIRLPLPTFGGPALRAVYSRKVCHFVLLRAHFAIPSEQLRRCARDVMAITKMRFLLIGRNKRGLLRPPWTKVLLSMENEKCLARPPRLWPPCSFFFGAVPAVLADANNQTDHHGLSAQRPAFRYAFIFLDNAFHFLEDAPVALVSFLLWGS